MTAPDHFTTHLTTDGHKPAPTEYPIHDLLAQRWSPRAYSSRAIDYEVVHRLFEAARWTPSSGNAQPWAFIVAYQGEAAFDQIVACLTGKNPLWAKDAPLLMLTIAKTVHASGAPNRYALHDLGAAVANLSLQATAEGLYVHQMGGYKKEELHAALDVPPEYDSAAVVAIGYFGNIETLADDDLKTREAAPRVRKSTDQFVFGGKFGEALP